jgi:hypothetical protein
VQGGAIMTSRDKGILPQKTGFDKGALSWKGNFHHVIIPIFYDGGGDMKEVNGSSLYDLGQINKLALLQIGPLAENRYIPELCIQILREFNGLPFSYKLPHTVEYSIMIANNLEIWINTPDAQVTHDNKFSIIRSLDQFRTLLFSELGKLTTIILEEKNGYSVDSLWKNQTSFLTRGVSNHLSKFVKVNLSEAAKCLVLHCYTAVGFHCVRLIEHVARSYFELIKGQKPINTDGRYKPLAAIADELLTYNNNLDKSKKSNDLVIIASLVKAINKEKRDPLSHPEIIDLKEHEAIEIHRDALQIVIKVVNDAKEGGSHFTTPWKRGYLF